MLVTKVELWPHGDQARRKEIARINIWNKGHGFDSELFDYGYHMIEATPLFGAPIDQEGILHGYNRRQQVLRLLREVINELPK
jgi:hypothetical protein